MDAPPPDPVAAIARARLAPRNVTLLAAPPSDADALEGALALFPTRVTPLMPFLQALRRAIRPDGAAVVVDLVWQTAPTPELLRAFAPAPGREKVRPVEGYEMQIEHAGFAIRARETVPRAEWTAGLAPEARAAVEADARGAARVVLWTIEPSDD